MTSNPATQIDLADLSDFAAAVAGIRKSMANFGPSYTGETDADGLYCATCGGRRRMYIARLYWKATIAEKKEVDFTGKDETPALFLLGCVQCQTTATAVVYRGPDGPDLAILSSGRGGLTTPNTPENVAYYLDQAHRAESISATSAAVAMYRSALEMLLFDQGYEKGMLKAKIDDLLTTPPTWVSQIDSEFLTALKNLGNAAVHPNGGDVVKQKALDRGVLLEIRVVFEELLDIVYERPARDKARRSKLKAAEEAFTT